VPRAPQFALTAGEGADIATLIEIGIKAGFGRLRPSQSQSHTAFFHGGGEQSKNRLFPPALFRSVLLGYPLNWW
jgi:hypothetical protein